MHNSIAKWISVVNIENGQQAIGVEQWSGSTPLLVQQPNKRQQTVRNDLRLKTI